MKKLRMLLLCLSGLAQAQWSHVMPVDLYQSMNLAQRSALDQAMDLYNRGGQGRNRNEQQLHRNAANEWERFRVQHGGTLNPEIFAYSFLMQALSQRGAHERHTAVRTFTEVLDFFPEETWIAAPALYFRALTHFDIGDTRRGFEDLQALAGHESYRTHALAADALNRIAANHWTNMRPREALNLWKAVVENFEGRHRDAEGEARNCLMDWEMVQGSLETAWQTRRQRENRGTEIRRDINATSAIFGEGLRDLYGRYQSWYFHHLHKEEDGNRLRDQRREALYAWFVSKEPLFAEAEDEWVFLIARYDYHARFQQEQLDELLLQTAQYLRNRVTDPAQRRNRARELINRLIGQSRWDNAISLLEFIPEAVDRLWTEYGIHQRRRAWDNALRALDQVDALQDPEQTRRALRERASIFHRQLNRYEEAIKLYHEINDPPGTLWEIVDCHRRARQRAEARTVLTEIASIFPDQAARAVFTQAEHHRADGEREAAVTLYLRVLRHPEWTKTREASQSHDRLEAMGLDTAGGVIHDVN